MTFPELTVGTNSTSLVSHVSDLSCAWTGGKELKFATLSMAPPAEGRCGCVRKLQGNLRDTDYLTSVGEPLF